MTREKALAQRAALRDLERRPPGMRLLYGSEQNVQPDGSLGWDDAFLADLDAHAIGHLDDLRYGVATAQRAWIPAARVINTWPPERLERFLDKRDRS